MLEENRALGTLNLLGNDLGAAGATSLAAGLEKNHSLRYLNVSSCSLGDAGDPHPYTSFKWYMLYPG